MAVTGELPAGGDARGLASHEQAHVYIIILSPPLNLTSSRHRGGARGEVNAPSIETIGYALAFVGLAAVVASIFGGAFGLIGAVSGATAYSLAGGGAAALAAGSWLLGGSTEENYEPENPYVG